MTPELIIYRQDKQISKQHAELATLRGWILALAIALAIFMTLTLWVAMMSAETQDKLTTAEIALANLKK